MGDNLRHDFLIRMQPGGFYGWPYAFIGRHPMPDGSADWDGHDNHTLWITAATLVNGGNRRNVATTSEIVERPLATP